MPKAAPQAWHVSRLTRVAILLLLVVLMLRRRHAVPLCRPMLGAHGLCAVVSLHTVQHKFPQQAAPSGDNTSCI